MAGKPVGKSVCQTGSDGWLHRWPVFARSDAEAIKIMNSNAESLKLQVPANQANSSVQIFCCCISRSTVPKVSSDSHDYICGNRDAYSQGWDTCFPQFLWRDNLQSTFQNIILLMSQVG